MSTEEGNRLYLVCESHQTLPDALELGERHGQRYAPQSILARIADGWFMRHAKCGPGDHFKLAYAQPQNWDHSPPAPPVANAVRLALVNGEVTAIRERADVATSRTVTQEELDELTRLFCQLDPHGELIPFVSMPEPPE